MWQPNRLGLCQTILKLTSLVSNFQSMIFETVDTSFRNSQVTSFVSFHGNLAAKLKKNVD